MTNEEAIKEIQDASDYEVRHGDIEHHYEDIMRRVEAFEKAVNALQKEPRWIPVSERTPEEHVCDDGFVEPSVSVLVQLNNKDMKVSRYWGSREKYKDKPWIDLSYPTTLEVVAWMPLPGPYEEREGKNETN